MDGYLLHPIVRLCTSVKALRATLDTLKALAEMTKKKR